MPTLAVTNFNIVSSTLGGFITLFALVSYLLKERLYLSEACESLSSTECWVFLFNFFNGISSVGNTQQTFEAHLSWTMLTLSRFE
jgi:hypothetical protein